MTCTSLLVFWECTNWLGEEKLFKRYKKHSSEFNLVAYKTAEDFVSTKSRKLNAKGRSIGLSIVHGFTASSFQRTIKTSAVIFQRVSNMGKIDTRSYNNYLRLCRRPLDIFHHHSPMAWIDDPKVSPCLHNSLLSSKLNYDSAIIEYKSLHWLLLLNDGLDIANCEFVFPYVWPGSWV